MEHTEILAWLREEDETRLETLWRRADAVRRENVGDAVHLRGLVEISNCCVRQCAYCGIGRGNTEVARYRMSAAEITGCVRQAVEFGYGTVVLQSGEDPGIGRAWMADLIRRIKVDTPLAVTLSLGERCGEDLAAWREAGADRYLLRFETSNRTLYDRIHPPLDGRRSDRIAILRRLQELGYEAGSGVMIGIPGQTYDDLADDIETFRTLDLDMIGVGPYLPHPATPLGRGLECGLQPVSSFRVRASARTFDSKEEGYGLKAALPAKTGQVPNTEGMTYKVVALARLACPRANIPSTTALATLNRASGRELGLLRGANIVMPNLTPAAYRKLYEIYPAKACLDETVDESHACLRRRIPAIGRQIGTGRGDSRRRDLAALAAQR